jgi:hypothetical protein
MTLLVVVPSVENKMKPSRKMSQGGKKDDMGKVILWIAPFSFLYH